MATQLIQDRWPQLQQEVPEIFSSQGTMLYVGANKNRHHYMPDFYTLGYEITLLEIWEPSLRGIEHKKMIHRAVLGDVRHAADTKLGKNMFDVVFYWHGPEHLRREDLEDTLFGLERITNRAGVLGSPWGKYPQGAVNGNPFETHASALTPADYQQYGYQTATLGVENVIDSNVLAWKLLRPQRRRRSAKKDIWLANIAG